MQGANKKGGKLSKKLKLVANEAAAIKSNTDENSDHGSVHERSVVDTTSSCEPARDDPTTGPTTRETTNNATATIPNIIEPQEPLGEGEQNDGVMAGSASISLVDDDRGIPGSDLSVITHADGLDILDEYFEKSATVLGPSSEVLTPEPPTPLTRVALPGSPGLETTPSAGLDAELPKESEIPYPERAIDSVEARSSISHSGSPGSVSCINPTRCPSYETTATDIDSLDMAIHPPFKKLSVLDHGPQLLDHVLVALDSTYDDRRAPTSCVPGVLDEIHTKSDHAVFVRIMTSITENWARCNRLIARLAIEVAQERLAVLEPNGSSRTMRNPCQMSITRGDRTKSDHLWHTIACRDRRELSEMELRDILSEPLEFMGEFNDENDYENAIKRIEKENADDARTQLRRMWKETYYWPMVQQRAKMIGPLPNASGPRTEITPHEKLAAKKLVAAMGYGQSRSNIFKWTSYLKLLSDLREKGATSFLLCRTSEFKNYFFQHAKDLDILLSWNKVYDFPLRQLRLRIIAEEADDFSGKTDIEERWIYERLHAPQNMCWGDHLCAWDRESRERDEFMANCSLKPTSTKSNIHILRHGIKGQLDRNKSIYISLIPYKGKSDKIAFSNKAASADLLGVAPLVAIAPGDFLGIFPGRLRYTDRKPARAIGGPVLNLWLDYLEVMGKLNKIKVAKDGEVSNVCLAWEGVNEVKGDKSSCQYLRVLVLATRHIMPFDQLIRPVSRVGVFSG
ncbi:hypothetical protein VE00_05409 [Pseudogymnoascus sp. WSF 3629]|nr:hypothetical protein VE00_05409 [Pseudogymnoascus sp. WSF 3629]